MPIFEVGQTPSAPIEKIGTPPSREDFSAVKEIVTVPYEEWLLSSREFVGAESSARDYAGKGW